MEDLREKVYLAAVRYWMPLTNIAFFVLDETLPEEEVQMLEQRQDECFAWDIRTRQNDAKIKKRTTLCVLDALVAMSPHPAPTTQANYQQITMWAHCSLG